MARQLFTARGKLICTVVALIIICIECPSASARASLSVAKAESSSKLIRELGGAQKIRSNPKLLEKYLGTSIEELKSELNKNDFKIKGSKKDQGNADSRMSRSRSRQAITPMISSKAFLDGVGNTGMAVVEAASKRNSAIAVVPTDAGASTLSDTVIPRLVGAALEDYIDSNDLDGNGMAPIFPDSGSDSVQTTTYTRSSSTSPPAPGTFRVHQDHTDLTYMRGGIDAAYYFIDFNLENFLVEIPITSDTFKLKFTDPDEIEASIDLSGSRILITFDGQLYISPLLQIAIAYLGEALGGMGSMFLQLMDSANVLRTLNASFTDLKLEKLVLALDRSAGGEVFIKEVKEFDLDIGRLVIEGSEFISLVNDLAFLLGTISDVLGLSEGIIDGCTTMDGCLSQLAEAFFLSGSLFDTEEEDCWTTDELGNRILATDSKSMKCVLIQTLNTALVQATRLELGGDAISISTEKQSLSVDNSDLVTKWSVDFSSNLERGSCVKDLSEYVNPGSSSYSINPKGDIDLFFPVTKLEEIIHLKVLEGSFCYTFSSVGSQARNEGEPLSITIAPAGQVEIDVGIESGFIESATNYKSIYTAGANQGKKKRTGNNESTFWVRIPLSFAVEGVVPIGNTAIAGDFNAIGSIEAEVEMSCSTMNAIYIRFLQGSISEMMGEIETNGRTQDCSDSSCKFYDSIFNLANSQWSSFVVTLNDLPIELPTLGSLDEIGVYVELDSSNTRFIDRSALRIPLNLKTSDPCSSPGGRGIDPPPDRPDLSDIERPDDSRDNDDSWIDTGHGDSVEMDPIGGSGGMTSDNPLE